MSICGAVVRGCCTFLLLELALPVPARANTFQQHVEAYKTAFLRGDLDAAENEARGALEEAERVGDEPATGAALSGLGWILMAKGRYAEAKEGVERGLRIAEKTLGPEHVETAAMLSQLGTICWASGDRARGESLMRRSVGLKEKGFGPDHPFTAVASSTLADLLAEKGEYGEAATLHRRSLAAIEKAWPPSDVSIPVGFRLNVATAMEGLSRDYLGQLRLEEAEDLVKRAGALRERLVGADHPSMGGNRTTLGLVHQAKGKDVEAEGAFREALRMAEKAKGGESMEVSSLLGAIAESCVRQGKHEVAAGLYDRVVALDARILAAGHPLRETHLQHRAALLKRMDRRNVAAGSAR